MSNIIQFKGTTYLDLDPDTVLENTKGKLNAFIIMGYDKSGKLWVSSTTGNIGANLVMIEIGKKELLKGIGE